MSGNAYDLYYLPDGKAIDASKAAGVDNLVKLRARIVGNDFFVDLIKETGVSDVRIKRIGQLLEGVSQYGREFCNTCDDVFEICARDPRRYRGPDYALTALKVNMDRTADFAYEFSKRILLYLELLNTTGSTMHDNAKTAIKMSIETQKELIFAVRLSVINEMALDVRPPPGPASLPHGHPQGVANPEEKDFRTLVDGKPVLPQETSLTTDEVGPVNWRYDPGFKVPGSPYCKFLRFPGPFFAPRHDPQDPYDRFFLPESLTQILFHYVRKYDQVQQNLVATGRLQLPSDNQEEAEQLLRKKAIGVILAEMTGENYDLFSIADKFSHQENVENTTEPYIYRCPATMIRQVNSGSGTGKFKPEDVNRGLKVAKTGEHHHVNAVDEGMCIKFDRLMWD